LSTAKVNFGLLAPASCLEDEAALHHMSATVRAMLRLMWCAWGPVLRKTGHVEDGMVLLFGACGPAFCESEVVVVVGLGLMIDDDEWLQESTMIKGWLLVVHTKATHLPLDPTLGKLTKVENKSPSAACASAPALFRPLKKASQRGVGCRTPIEARATIFLVSSYCRPQNTNPALIHDAPTPPLRQAGRQA